MSWHLATLKIVALLPSKNRKYLFRKLDYVLFHMDNMYNDMLIEYGSGLHGMFPSKSPLNHNLSNSLLGDSVSEVPSPEATD